MAWKQLSWRDPISSRINLNSSLVYLRVLENGISQLRKILSQPNFNPRRSWCDHRIKWNTPPPRRTPKKLHPTKFLTKQNFWPKYFGPNFFLTPPPPNKKNVFDPKKISIPLPPNYFFTKMFWWPKNCSDHKIFNISFFNQKFFWPNVFLNQFLFKKIFFSTKK